MKFKLEKKNTATFDAEEGARAQLDWLPHVHWR